MFSFIFLTRLVGTSRLKLGKTAGPYTISVDIRNLFKSLFSKVLENLCGTSLQMRLPDMLVKLLSFTFKFSQTSGAL